MLLITSLHSSLASLCATCHAELSTVEYCMHVAPWLTHTYVCDYVCVGALIYLQLGGDCTPECLLAA